MINRVQEHCAVAFGGSLYDVTGKILSQGFHEAGSREIAFMRKNYVPHFQAEQLEIYLTVMLQIKRNKLQNEIFT